MRIFFCINQYIYQRMFASRKGFTLLEITVVATIIILLTVIFMASYRGGEAQFALLRSASKLAQDLRRAQEMAMSSQEFKGAFQGGYGIHFDISNPNLYILFADCDGDELYGGESLFVCDDCSVAPCIPDVFLEKKEEIKLEEGIKIVSLSPPSPLHITFFPPDPTVTIFGGNEAIITLSLKDDLTITKTVTVNKVGLIEIE